MIDTTKAALIMCILSAAFYSAETVIADVKLSKTSPLILTLIASLGIAVIAGTLLIIQPPEKNSLPGKKDIVPIFMVIIFFFLADYTHFAALNKDSGAVILATCYLLIPIFCSILKWEQPSWKMLTGWILGGAAMLLVAKEMLEKE